ncbi:MAG: GGDEF domain-containing protein [Enterocloster asparagiformis]|nr:GGDEF domain-containing protein [Enterocloster asparagiformis]
MKQPLWEGTDFNINTSLSKEQLQRENLRLQALAELDGLTGIYNRITIEQKVNQALAVKRSGAILVFDLDNFKNVNDQYGHIAGDELLQNVAYILKKTMKNNLVARTGGDEFVIFYHNTLDIKGLSQQKQMLQKRLGQIKIKSSKQFTLSASFGEAIYMERDDYIKMFNRADQLLLQKKQALHNVRAPKCEMDNRSNKRVEMDTKLIQHDLQERVPAEGAYYLSYEVFQGIYRFLERTLCRDKYKDDLKSFYVILFTLSEKESGVLKPENQEQVMLLLKALIHNNLRRNDIFVQYSSCQYLVLVSDADEAGIEVISRRIKKHFYENQTESTKDIILQHSFPLQASETKDGQSSTSERFCQRKQSHTEKC